MEHCDGEFRTDDLTMRSIGPVLRPSSLSEASGVPPSEISLSWTKLTDLLLFDFIMMQLSCWRAKDLACPVQGLLVTREGQWYKLSKDYFLCDCEAD